MLSLRRTRCLPRENRKTDAVPVSRLQGILLAENLYAHGELETSASDLGLGNLPGVDQLEGR